MNSEKELAIRNAITHKANDEWKLIFAVVLVIAAVPLVWLSLSILEWSEWLEVGFCIVVAMVVAGSVASALRGLRYVDRAQEAALQNEREWEAQYPDYDA